MGEVLENKPCTIQKKNITENFWMIWIIQRCDGKTIQEKQSWEIFDLKKNTKCNATRSYLSRHIYIH